MATARAFSALGAALMVPAVFALARSLALDRTTALLAAALAVFVPFTIYYAHEIRMYTWLTTGGALLLALTARILRDVEDGRARFGAAAGARLLAWACLAVGLVLLHNYGVLLIAGAGLLVGIDAARRGSLRPLAVFGGLLAATLPALVPQLLRGAAAARGPAIDWLEVAGRVEVETPWRVADALLSGPMLDPGPLALRWALLAAAVAGAAALWRPEAVGRDAWRRRTPLLLAAFLAALPVAISLGRPITLQGQRYLIYAVPAVLVVLAQIVRGARPRRAALLALLLASVWLPYVWKFQTTRHQRPFDAVARELEARVTPGDRVLAWPGMDHRVLRWLSDGRLPARPLDGASVAEVLGDAGPARVWVVSESASPTADEQALGRAWKPVRSRRFDTDQRDTLLRVTLYGRD